MLIRTQNKLQLIIPSSIYIIATRLFTNDNENNFIYKIMTNYANDKEPDLLGIYDDMDTAISVLDEIQNSIILNNLIYNMPSRENEEE